jgi:hypothetical protein
MQQFKIRDGGFNEIRKKILLRTIPMLFLAGGAGIAISMVNSKNKKDDINVLPFTIPLFLVAGSIGLYRGTSRQKAAYESYTLSIGNGLITREQVNTVRIAIPFDEIRQITRYKAGNFTIKGNKPSDLILIPAQVDNAAQLELTLQDIKGITTKETESILQKYPAITALVTVGLMICVYALQNKIIVGISGTILIGLMLWSFFKMRSNKNIDNRTKHSSWLIFIVLASVIGVMIFKLSGMLPQQR